LKLMICSRRRYKRWAKRTGHEILKFDKEGTILTLY